MRPWVAPADGFINVHQTIAQTGPQLPSDYDANVTLTIKRDGERLAKLRAEIRDGVLPGPQALDARIEVTKGERLYFSADITAAETADKNAPAPAEVVLISSPSVIYESSQPVTVQPTSTSMPASRPSDAFGGRLPRLVVRPVQRPRRRANRSTRRGCACRSTSRTRRPRISSR